MMAAPYHCQRCGVRLTYLKAEFVPTHCASCAKDRVKLTPVFQPTVPDNVHAKMPVKKLGFSTRALTALSRTNVETAEDLWILDEGAVQRMLRVKGIGRKTLREVEFVRAALRQRWPQKSDVDSSVSAEILWVELKEAKVRMKALEQAVEQAEEQARLARVDVVKANKKCMDWYFRANDLERKLAACVPQKVLEEQTNALRIANAERTEALESLRALRSRAAYQDSRVASKEYSLQVAINEMRCERDGVIAYLEQTARAIEAESDRPACGCRMSTEKSRALLFAMDAIKAGKHLRSER